MTGIKRRATPIVLREPKTGPISDQGYRQAVTALAAMIQQWWTRNDNNDFRPTDNSTLDSDGESAYDTRR